MKLSIVATMYRSAEYVDPFCERIEKAAREITDDFEIILVNDGSPDDSLQRAIARAEDDPHLIVVDLSRNFGHHKAMMTGLGYTQGDLVYLTDIDLEELPEWVISFHAQMKEQLCDVVYGKQATRRGDWFERWSGQWFYSLVNALTNLDLPHNLVTSRLMTRRYVQALLRFKEREFFIAGLWQLAGFDQRPQIVTKQARNETTYTLRRKLNILVQMVTSFSAAPLKLTFYFGVLIFGCAALYTAYLVINQLFLANPLPGWTSVIASVWLLGGTIIALIGMIGIYLAKIFTETKHRPYTIVRHVHGADKQRPTVLNAEVLGMRELIEEVASYYSNKLAEHGETPRGVDWNGEECQTLRFAQLARVIEPGHPYSVNDLGCGYGALFEYLRQRPEPVDYNGIDVSSDMVNTAQARYQGVTNACFVVSNRPDRQADYGVASGIFNVRQERNDEEWRRYIIEALAILDQTSQKGFAFNCLTSYSDADKMRSYLYYADPLWLFDLCKRQYSKDVALLHDYGLFEFTILVRKSVTQN